MPRLLWRGHLKTPEHGQTWNPSEAEIGLAEFSRWADTIPRETPCSVTKRVPRLYRTTLGL